jgi:ABC-2 type transport system permease protein
MFEEAEKLYSFMKRDMISFSTYKTSMTLTILGTIFGALSYAYLGANATMQVVLKEYNMTLVTYLIIGTAFTAYIGQVLSLVQRTINPWWLEEVLVSPTRLSTFIIGSSLWGFVWSGLVVLVYLAVGSAIFAVNFAVNVPATALVLALGTVALIGFSMLGAGVLILTKQGDPVTWLIQILTTLFGNVFFPPEVMPSFLRAVSYALPQYYFISSIRLTLTGQTFEMVLPNVLILALTSTLLLPLGYLAYSWCLRTAKRNGTLSWY